MPEITAERRETPRPPVRRGADRLVCPFCGELGDDVIASRPTDRRDAIHRRRECWHCGKRYTTAEQIIPSLR